MIRYKITKYTCIINYIPITHDYYKKCINVQMFKIQTTFSIVLRRANTSAYISNFFSNLYLNHFTYNNIHTACKQILLFPITF